jgi:undecaprenyl diphosphate synthase
MNSIRHVAIIMDGNGRWAEQRGMPRWKGHEKGAEAVRRVTEAACRHGIQVLTLFAFSSENWKRPAKEVHILFSLFRRFLAEQKGALVENGIRLSAIGRRDRFSPTVRKALADAEDATRAGTRLHLRLALDYGARFEIVETARAIAHRVFRGELRPEELDEDRFERAMSPDPVEDPDLIIRTAGERRLSNFLLWQAAYSELHFSPTLWPDYDENDFEEAVADYHSRTRKYGAVISATGTIG